jgi:hypothetical protein
MTAVRILEKVIRPAPIGLRFLDVATGQIVSNGLRVTATLSAPRQCPVALSVNRSGVWYAPRLAGLNDVPDFQAQPKKTYHIEAIDAFGRYLPMTVELDFPASGIANWPDWGSLPLDAIAPLVTFDTSTPPRPIVCRDALPLFASPVRTVPPAMAEIRCQLARTDTGEPAAWALITASHKGKVCGIGQADNQGAVALFFPWPGRPRAGLPAIADFKWELKFQAYWSSLDPNVVPMMADVLDQLNHPRDLFESTETPRKKLPSQILSFGRAMTLRTAQTPDGPSSFLMVAA